jgi:hypothetical protein
VQELIVNDRVDILAEFVITLEALAVVNLATQVTSWGNSYFGLDARLRTQLRAAS